MVRSLNRKPAWHRSGGKGSWRYSCRRMTAEQFHDHDFVMNVALEPYHLPAEEAFEVRDDITGETIGIVWSCKNPFPMHLGGGLSPRFTHSWLTVSHRHEIGRIGPVPRWRSANRYGTWWWKRGDAIEDMLADEQRHKREIQERADVAAELDDFYA